MQPVQHPVWDLLRFVLVLLVIAVSVRVFVFQPFIVSGNSMLPHLQDKNYLVVEQVSYRFNEPERGDVIVFHYPFNAGRFLVKRIIALPGETISFSIGLGICIAVFGVILINWPGRNSG